MYESVRIAMLISGSLACAACNAEPQAAENQSDAAASCVACHQGPLALDGWSVDELVEHITAIRDGAAAHPPVEVDLASAARVEELARALANP